MATLIKSLGLTMRRYKTLLLDLATSVISSGGVTLNPDTLTVVKLKAGYVASYHEPEIVTSSLEIALLECLRLATLDRLGYVGIWHDTKSNTYIINKSVMFNDKQEAMTFAKAQQQKCIYDASDNCYLYI